ncbi:MAG: hypothetical protein H7252_03985 [Cytophaga sp.]|nr:hypothetical protein [Undibacterium sp.]
MHSAIQRLQSILLWFSKHPVAAAGVLCLLYLALFQFRFVSTGDSWAEAFYEYVHGAVANSWQGFFYTGIAGYFNFLPKILAYGYVWLGLPLQYIDYFFRAAVIAYTVCCLSFIAHQSNRDIIKNDYLRIACSVLTLMTFYHISSFSFINVWYVGFVPIMLISLRSKRFSAEWQEVLYVVFAVSVCLTKPSLVLAPLVLYRTIRLKEYLLGSILIFAITLQTALFFTSSYFHNLPVQVHVGLITKGINVLIYIGLIFLKLFRIQPYNIAFVLAGLLLVLILAWCVKNALGYIKAALLSITLLLIAYTGIYSPDAPSVSLRTAYKTLYVDQMKLQREVLIYFFIILFICIALQYARQILQGKKMVSSQVLTIGTLAIVALLAVAEFRTIDVHGNNLYINLDAYRPDLRTNTATCIPIAPTPSWGVTPNGAPGYGWYYENGTYGSCDKTNYDKSIKYTSFTHQLRSGLSLTLNNRQSAPIKSVLIPIANPQPGKGRIVVLTDQLTGKSYSSRIMSKSSSDKLSFVAFNVAAEQLRPQYEFTVTEPGVFVSDLSLGTFTDGSLAQYSYFLIHP